MEKNIVWETSELKNIECFSIYSIITPQIIESFLETIIGNASVRTNISKGDIARYNQEYYDYFEELFAKNNTGISVHSEEFKKLCLMFKVPAIKNKTRSEEKILPGDDIIVKERTKKCNILDIPKEEMLIGNIREKREEDLLGYPQNEDKLLSSYDYSCNNDKANYSHLDCLSLFNKLSTKEKIKFIMEFQNIEIKLTPSEILVFKSC